MDTTALPQGATRLDDWGVIRAQGPDARSFLQAQLTQDMLSLQPGQARLAGWCSAKGRLLASFVVWARGPEELLLACSADLLPATLKRLTMFVLRAKCKLGDASAELPLWGLVGDARGLAIWQESQDLIRLPDGLGQPRLLQAGGEAPTLPALEPAAWRWLEAWSAVPRVVAATADQFVPQTVNFELVGGVNFQKGCYPGQEVVARSQYRGTVKRRGVLLEGGVALAPGQEVFHSADPEQPAGLVVLAGSWAGRHAALVQLKTAALEGGSLHALSASGPLLMPAALPYELPAEAA
jgi:folate-binding protein YgfZ